jgi:rhamnosyl/mannosyltransferase
MKRLCVLHLGKYYPPVRGGIETVVETLCRGEAAWVDSSALVLGTRVLTTFEHRDGVGVRRVGSVARLGAVSVAPTLPLWLARARADVLVLHEPNPMALIAYFLARPPIPLVVWYHSEVIRPRWQYRLLYEPLLEFALRRAARIVVASPPMREVRALARYRHKCTVVPFGLPIDRYRQAPKIEPPQPSPRARFLFAGRLVGYKGIDVLLRALPGLDAETVIVGDGPLRSSLESLSRDLGIADRVRFLGEVADHELLACLRACDVFVLPSVTRQEAFGMVQLEAMLCARPVVSTELGTGVSWVNQHERTGLVVTPGDVNELRQALTRLLDDRDLRRRLGAAAQARVLSHFTADGMCSTTRTLYREVVDQGPAATQAEPARGLRRRSMLAKRAFDVVLAGLGLIASAPLWAVIAVLVKLEDGGPVFYEQERSGLHGVPFRVRKFRSMIIDAEARVGAVQATQHDPRVTRVGRLLRATAMDELPQLWSIFSGDMSFTGPRALRPGEIEALGSGRLERLEDVPGFAVRASVPPGLTGIAQIFAPRDIPRRLKFRYDILYVRRQSFWLDIRLVALSFWITFRGAWEIRGSKF